MNTVFPPQTSHARSDHNCALNAHLHPEDDRSWVGWVLSVNVVVDALFIPQPSHTLRP
jgi:hypothetical protein